MSKVYRGTVLLIWLVSSALVVLDRFYWNLWPRQSICTDGCGNDFFCPIDEVRKYSFRSIENVLSCECNFVGLDPVTRRCPKLLLLEFILMVRKSLSFEGMDSPYLLT